MSSYPAFQIDTRHLAHRAQSQARLAYFTGRYDELSPAQQDAILDLTTRRFVDEVFHVDDYLDHCEHLERGTPEFTKAYNERVAVIRRTLAEDHRDTFISAILLDAGNDRWFAIAAMRAVPGGQATQVAETLRRADSTIPTHKLMQHIEYPRLSDFDPEAVSESQLFCISRLVTIDKAAVNDLVESTSISRDELQSALATAFSRLIATIFRIGNATADVRGWIFNIEPWLACVLKTRKRLNLVPLFAGGVEPTPFALSSPVYGPHFRHWRPELQKLVPDIFQREGIRGAIRHLASREIREWHDCKISLPYLLVNNAEMEQAVQKLEAEFRDVQSDVATGEDGHERGQLARVC